MGSELSDFVRKRFDAPIAASVLDSVAAIADLDRFVQETVGRWEEEADWIHAHLRSLVAVEESEENEDDDVAERSGSERLRRGLTRPRDGKGRRKGDSRARASDAVERVRQTRVSASRDLPGQTPRKSLSEDHDHAGSRRRSSRESSDRSRVRKGPVELELPEAVNRVSDELFDRAPDENPRPRRESRNSERDDSRSTDAAAIRDGMVEREFDLLDEVFGPLPSGRRGPGLGSDIPDHSSRSEVAADESELQSSGVVASMSAAEPGEASSVHPRPIGERGESSGIDWSQVRSKSEREWRQRGF